MKTRRMKGSITIFLSLCSTLFIALICTAVESARIQGVRAKAAAVLDMGLFSLFGEYEGIVWDNYDVFFLDGAAGTGNFSTERMGQKLDDYMSYNISAGKGLPFSGKDLLKVYLQESTISGYELVTDGNGEAFYRQAVSYMRENAAQEAIRKLQSLADQGEKLKENADSYEESSKEVEERREKLLEEQSQSEEETDTPVPETPIENPLDSIKKVKEMGILGLVLADSASLSAKEIKKDELPSKRSLNQGNLETTKKQDSAADKLLFQQYLLSNFGSFRKNDGKGGLDYELEYLIGGQNEDSENLKKVVHKLLLIREGSNFLYAMSSEEMRNQALALATVLVGVAAVPGLITITKIAILLAWAYGESLLDVRCLLAGGKVAPVKNASTWKLSLQNLGSILEVLKEVDKGSGEGLGYDEYIQILLLTGDTNQYRIRALDMIEGRCRRKFSAFRVDHCIVRIEVSTKWNAPPVFLNLAASIVNIDKKGVNFSVNGVFAYE